MLFPPVTSAHVGGINSGGNEGYFIRRIKLRPMSSICFSPNFSSSHLLFSFSFSFYRHAISFSFRRIAALWCFRRKTPLRAAVLIHLSQEKPLHRTCEVLSRSCRRILDTTRLGVFSRDHPVLRLLYLFGGYAMHYAISCISRKLLSRFSHAFCMYPQCFTLRDDCIDKTCAMYTRVLSI